MAAANPHCACLPNGYFRWMLETSPLLLATIMATFFAAGVIKGITGMGLPTVAMGVLGAVVSPLAAAGLVVFPSLVTNVWQLLAGPNLTVLIRRLLPMMAAIMIGTIGASPLLTGATTQLTTLALGATLVAYASYALMAPPIAMPTAWEGWMSPAVGLATGVVTGATGVFVIPAVPYLQALGLEKEELVQALGLSFTVSTVALAVGLGAGGGFRIDEIALSALAVVPALVGVWAGQIVRQAVSPAAFKRWFLITLMVIGGHMLLREIT